MSDELNNVMSAIYDSAPTIDDIGAVGVEILDGLASLKRNGKKPLLFIRFICTNSTDEDTAYGVVDFCILEKDGWKVRTTITELVDNDLISQTSQFKYPQNQWEELLRLIQVSLEQRWSKRDGDH